MPQFFIQHDVFYFLIGLPEAEQLVKKFSVTNAILVDAIIFKSIHKLFYKPVTNAIVAKGDVPLIRSKFSQIEGDKRLYA